MQIKNLKTTTTYDHIGFELLFLRWASSTIGFPTRLLSADLNITDLGSDFFPFILIPCSTKTYFTWYFIKIEYSFE